MNNKITRVLLVEDEEDAREILGFYLDTIQDSCQLAPESKAIRAIKSVTKIEKPIPEK